MHFKFAFLPICIALLFSVFGIGGEPASFERIGPFGGDVRSLLIDTWQPDVVYLGTSNGRIYKSSNSGNTWAPLYPGIGQSEYVIDTLISHPTERDHIYAGGWDLHSDGGGLFESRDAGITWARIMLPQPFSAVRGLAICRTRPDHMIVGTLSGAYVSADGGYVWRKAGSEDLQKAESVAIDPNDYRNLYVGTWRLGYKSTDFGKTWTRIEKGMPLDSDIFSITIDARNPAIVYSSACSGVYRSANRAQSWQRLRILPDRFTIRAQVVHIDPGDARRVYTGTTEGLFVSENEGKTWKRLTSNNVTVNAIQVDQEDSRRILIGTEYQGILRSEDRGKTWKESNTGFVHQQISWIVADPFSPGQFVAGVLSGGGGLYLYDDKAATWTSSQIEPGMRILSFLILPKDRGRLAGTTQGLYWQPRGSAPWTKLKGSIAKRTVYSLELDPAGTVIYAGTDQGIYRTSLAALDFRLPPGYRLSPQVWCIVAPQTSDGMVYAGSSLGLLRSWDRGTTWNVISAYGLPERATIEALAISPSDKDRLFAGTSVGLFESRNGGIHWRRADDGKLGVDVPAILFLNDEGSRILAADKTSGGIFYSQDGGEDWNKIFSPEYGSRAYDIVKDPEIPSRIYIGTRSDGVYRLDLP